jgi:hypothetical protein
MERAQGAGLLLLAKPHGDAGAATWFETKNALGFSSSLQTSPWSSNQQFLYILCRLAQLPAIWRIVAGLVRFELAPPPDQLLISR